MLKPLRIMIVGAGDVAKRLATSSVAPRVQWRALSRSAASREALNQCEILAVTGDLDMRRSLTRAAAVARASHTTLYLAPPPNLGNSDPRLARWLAAVGQRAPRPLRGQRKLSAYRAQQRASRAAAPLRNVYVSTTGVYGDRAGDWVDELTPLRAQSARAKRRVAAEQLARSHRSERMSILRAPGIYADTRLPVERLREKLPALTANEDVYSNHIHADDLAHAVWLAAFRGRAGRAYNVVDDASLKMGAYFDAVADALSLPRPPRMPRAELAHHVTPMMLSFMSESRRIRNARMKAEFRIRLRYPTPHDLLATIKPEQALQRPLI